MSSSEVQTGDSSRQINEGSKKAMSRRLGPAQTPVAFPQALYPLPRHYAIPLYPSGFLAINLNKV
ncbi:hypothetical protein E2C01_083563 [Portunus trituberculatus]|uniref:Uncharacterized protein n=1 Tax=Portunus trituberculatus TaxID=210409 RepID=A0A5B7J585_PORTR|nr:hypothetical protein [Portunus trituberculatus]